MAILGIVTYLAIHDASSPNDSGPKLPAPERAALRAASIAIVKLESYNYKTFDADLAAALPLVTANFKAFYTYTAQNVTRPEAVQGHQVSAVVFKSATLQNVTDDTYVFLMLFHEHITSTNASTIDQTAKANVTMQLVGGKWLLASLVPVATS